METGLRPSSAFAAFSAFLVLVLIMSAARAEDIVVSAQIGGDSQRTRFVAFVSKAVEFRIFSMADPYRIVIDMPETDIQVPGGKGRGLILSSRSGLLAPGKSRIVIDLAAPARIEKAELLPPENDLPARLVIDLARTTHKTFLASVKAPPPAPKPDESQSAAANLDTGDRRPLIVIDPGHGGIDAGAIGRATNTPEKEVTFDFCKKLASKLEATARYRIVMTRTSDVFVSLDDRAVMAVKAKADLLISIHADALDPKRLGIKALKEVRGGTIYTLSEEASDEQANVIAQNENKVDVQAGVASEQTAPVVSEEIASILNDLENRIKKNRSTAIAHYLIDHMKGKMKFNIRPQRSANFRVLKAHGVPAILIELGYLSNEDDEKLLISEEWRTTISSVLGEAVNAFMSERQAHIPL
ncbi:N-acetylmuramoyl-L-alanine amidase [Rhodomicrobium vannielii ATCC 17100]|uniref:N-acetylmuramoyl-L-alanine amidase n=1 Tax=Rhodomicrobium vannielii (strain ATCC 17100 / DSM 162 / LMG 4299 / NCIMB 10020 / ATH 3.1.1) TaxID=648757 RepID=E3I0F0_RHOVT|nr:N-acetylmuramoyl-L-alanine amidase [Rhodomicrobium vannielii]ADP72268.1 N-acetylmuramoyl-L-alanine amidase [Rhodomicrobium vannielii ATCC 17100]